MFISELQAHYGSDPLFKKICEKPKDHPRFTVSQESGLIWTTNLAGEKVICVPKSPRHARSLRTLVLEAGHRVVGHYGPQRTADYLRRWYWWPGIFGMCEQFCTSCKPCQTSKTSNRPPLGKLHPLPVPDRPWQSIGMDFVGPFPEVKGFNYLWVIICRLTSMVHLIPCHTKNSYRPFNSLYS